MPAALFGPNSMIDRKQYLVSFFYQALVAACATQFEIMMQGRSGATAALLGVLVFATGVGAFALMTLAIRARLSDCGMSPRWLALPLCFLALDMLRSVTGTPTAFVAGTTSLLSFAGLVLTAKTSVVALLLLLMFVPSLPGRHISVGTAS
jgi:uncharacterized membrane protein YhaH (DUF805 family)